MHNKLKVDNVTGLSNCLINSKSNWKDFVNKHDKYKNFSYITAGKIPPNPLRLLESKRMKNLIEDIKIQMNLISLYLIVLQYLDYQMRLLFLILLME